MTTFPLPAHRGGSPLLFAGLVLAGVAAVAALVPLFGTLYVAAIVAGFVVAGLAVLARYYPLLPIAFVLLLSSVSVIALIPAVRSQDARDGDTAEYAVLVGLALGVAALVTMLRRPHFKLFDPRSRPLDLIACLFVVAGAWMLVSGFLAGNHPVLVLRDAYRFLIVIPVYIIVASLAPTTSQLRRLLVIIAICMLIQNAGNARAAIDIVLAGARPRVEFIFWMQNFVGVVALFVLAGDAGRGPRKVIFAMAGAALVFVGFFSGFRTYLLILAATSVLPFVALAGGNTHAVRRLLGSLPLMVLGGLLLVALPMVREPVLGQAEVVITRVTNSFSDDGGRDRSSTNQRVIDTQMVLGKFTEDPVRAALGHGGGATFRRAPDNPPGNVNPYTNDPLETYYIHNSLAAMLYRGGPIAFAITVLGMAVPFWHSLRIARAHASLVYWFPFLVTSGFLLSSMFFTFVPGDLLYMVAFATTAALMRAEAAPEAARTAPLRRSLSVVARGAR